MYAQHVPLMMTTVETALKAKLKDNAFPAVGVAGGKPQEVLYAARVLRCMYTLNRTAFVSGTSVEHVYSTDTVHMF